jgi:hypothetical protein
MIIAIGLFAVLAIVLANKNVSRGISRADQRGLESYGQKARCEDTYPFDYLSW